MESNSSSAYSDQERDLRAFAGYPVMFSFGEASRSWTVPQPGAVRQEYENVAIHTPGPTRSPDLDAEFKSIASSSSSPFHSLSTTPDPVTNLVPLANLQASMLSWMPTEGIPPSFDGYGNIHDDGTLYGGVYSPAEGDVVNQWNIFLLDTGIHPDSPHDNF